MPSFSNQGSRGRIRTGFRSRMRFVSGPSKTATRYPASTQEKAGSEIASRFFSYSYRRLFLGEGQARQRLRVLGFNGTQTVWIQSQRLYDRGSNLPRFDLIYKRWRLLAPVRNNPQHVTVVVSEAAVLGHFFLAA